MDLFDAGLSVGKQLLGGLQARNQQRREQKFNAEQAQINREFQRDERIAAQEFDLDMWNKTNEYNSLASQIERAREAGVSPTSIIGDGSNSGFAHNLTSHPSSGTPTAPTPSIAGQMMLLPQQSELLEAQADNIQQDTRAKSLDYDYNSATFDDRVRAMKSEADNKDKEGQRIEAEIKKLVNDVDIANKYAEHYARMTEQQIAESKQRILNLENEYKNISKQREVMDADIDYKEAQTKATDADRIYQELKNSVSNEIGYPIDSPEFMHAWSLLKQNKLSELGELYLTKANHTMASSEHLAPFVGSGHAATDVVTGVLSDLKKVFSDAFKIGKKTVKNAGDSYDKGKSNGSIHQLR